MLQINATIIAGLFVFASVASIFPNERLDFSGAINSDPAIEEENRKQLADTIATINRSGTILVFTGIMILPFGASILFLLGNRYKHGKFLLGLGIGLIIAILLTLGLVYTWLGTIFGDLLSRAP